MWRLLRQSGVRKPAEDVEPVIHADHDHAVLGDGVAVVDGLGGGSRNAPAAVNPYQHGKPFIRRRRRSPHIEIQAILAGVDEAAVPGTAVGILGTLYARGREAVRGAHALPRRYRLRGTPSQLADRRRREGNAKVFANAPTPSWRAGDQAAFNFDRLLNPPKERK